MGATLVVRFGRRVSVGTARRFAAAVEAYASGRPTVIFGEMNALTAPEYVVVGLTITTVPAAELEAVEAILRDVASGLGLDRFTLERA